MYFHFLHNGLKVLVLLTLFLFPFIGYSIQFLKFVHSRLNFSKTFDCYTFKMSLKSLFTICSFYWLFDSILFERSFKYLEIAFFCIFSRLHISRGSIKHILRHISNVRTEIITATRQIEVQQPPSAAPKRGIDEIPS